MERIPEPELMEDEHQARVYSEADFSEAHDAVVALFAERLGAATGQVIDLGCGPADVTVRFARLNPDCDIRGVDGSDAMLRCGADRVAAAGLGDRIALEPARLPFAQPRSAYDVVLSTSLLHHLEDPSTLWNTVGTVGASGARVFVWDLRRPASVEEARGLLAAHAPDGDDVLRRDFYNSLLAAYRPVEIREQLSAAGLDGLVVEAIGDRHLIVWGRL